MELVLTILEAIASVALIVVVLLQSGKKAGLSGAIAGGSDTYMSKSGTISYPNRQGGEMKHLSFKEGYMVEYAETYDNKDEMQQYEEFTN